MVPLKLSDFNYTLPDVNIARRPLAGRDSARLLLRSPQGIRHHTFSELPELLPENSLLIFNETRVVKARLHFRRATGAVVEVFCLSPVWPGPEMSQAMQSQGSCVWLCMAGNQKRWKEGETLLMGFPGGALTATLLKKEGREVKVQFSWSPGDLLWAQVLELAGKIPLPPYLGRPSEDGDKENYQTMFARKEGAVAAPTASLHFSPRLMEALHKKGIPEVRITLHVGAGTFQPVEKENVLEHPMHNEQMVFGREAIADLADKAGHAYIPAGTTSLRALESLYWFGQQIVSGQAPEQFFIHKLYAYSPEAEKDCTRKEALQAILLWMDEKQLNELWGHTEIFIFPGYKFRMTDGLVTNFHQPQSTLLMLVSALIGDEWKAVYAEALKEQYRFLSYGDGSLLLPG